MFNQGLARGELPESMKASVTRLIHKKDDKRLLKNWRLISLLNVDYKMITAQKRYHFGYQGSLGLLLTQTRHVQFPVDQFTQTWCC